MTVNKESVGFGLLVGFEDVTLGCGKLAMGVFHIPPAEFHTLGESMKKEH